MVDLFFDLYIVQEDLTHPSVPSQEGRQDHLFGWSFSLLSLYKQTEKYHTPLNFTHGCV